MRDFQSGDINGDVNIVDNSNNNQFKLLIHCDNHELLMEEVHREELVKQERRKRFTHSLKLLVFCAVLLSIAATWYFFQGQMNVVSGLTGGAGVLIGLAGFAKGDTPTAFELRQLNTLKEIHTLLRERGVR